ncbi:MAG: 50S ribosomal protein L25 [Desulfobacterales bacterium]|nr:50S ribosomal protein L25 [Desulfobacterales bacterium]
MEFITLTSTVREKKGKGPARCARSDGKIPAVLYGPQMESNSLMIDSKEFETVCKQLHAANIFVKLQVTNPSNETTSDCPVLIKEIQKNPLTNKVIHVDFYAISMDRRISIRVPVVPVGKAKGTELGGLLQIIRRHLEIKCKPMHAPQRIEIDVNSLDIGDAIHVEDIVLSEGVEIPHDVNFTVITIVVPKGEKTVKTDEEAEEDTATAKAA